MSKYRDRLQIIADILSIVGRGAKKTWIMYQANLSYRLLCRYLDEVQDAGLIRFVDGKKYVLTAKAREFLTRHEEFSKRRKHMEEHVNNVNNDRAALESMCLNANATKRNSSARTRVNRRIESKLV